MKKILPLLFVALLGLAGCSRSSDPQPVPQLTTTLQAKWQGLTTRELETTPGGAVVTDRTTSYNPATYYLEFTATEALVYSGATVSKRSGYLRNGNFISSNPAVAGEVPQEIKELTATKLVLLSTASSGSNTHTFTTTYSR